MNEPSAATVYELAATIARYEEALRFYANTNNYYFQDAGARSTSIPVMQDCGNRAAIALTKTAAETTNSRQSVK